jgi:hypothetical protein
METRARTKAAADACTRSAEACIYGRNRDPRTNTQPSRGHGKRSAVRVRQRAYRISRGFSEGWASGREAAGAPRDTGSVREHRRNMSPAPIGCVAAVVRLASTCVSGRFSVLSSAHTIDVRLRVDALRGVEVLPHARVAAEQRHHAVAELGAPYWGGCPL